MTPLQVLLRGVVTLVTQEELEKKLRSGLPLRVKLGVDPTAPDIHLGHTVVLRKLRQFQDLGHQAVLIIGDFTARIGDPSGRGKKRPPLSSAQIEANAKTYLDQVHKTLRSDRLEVVRNSAWLSRLTFEDVIRLGGSLTVAQILEREDFQNRLKSGSPIGFHEFLYPLAQAYDSVHLRADVELGGTDQIFNILVGRDLQRALGQEPQIALVTPILVGTDGHERMSKSLDNYIGVSEPAFEMYSKLMAIPDSIMKNYYELLTALPMEEMSVLTDPSKTHPMQAKKRLAREITTMYHSSAEADEGAARWESSFSRREIPQEVPDLVVPSSQIRNGKIDLVTLVRLTEIPTSNSEARRLIEQGGVEVDRQRITDPKAEIPLREGLLLKVGKKKRYFRLAVR